MTTRIGIGEMAASQFGKELTFNELCWHVDALTAGVTSSTLAVPPASPAIGVTYIVPAGSSGAWAGQTGKIAQWLNNAWKFYTPLEGMTLWVNDLDKPGTYTSAGWVIFSGLKVISDASTFTRASDNAGDTVEQNLTTVQIPALWLGTSGALRITALWSVTNSASAKQLRVKLGSTSYLNFNAANSLTVQTTTLIRANGTSAQKGHSSGSSGLGASSLAMVTSAIDMTQEQTLTFACAWGANVASEAISLEGYLIESI